MEGAHNAIVSMDCKMTPEEFAKEYGIKNTFIVSYGENIQPTFAPFAKRFSALKEVKWSVLGESIQYTVSVESDVPVCACFGRLDVRQTNMAYYSVEGYSF